MDDYYCRRLLDSVPAIVKRSLRFDPIFARRLADPRVSEYLREAVRCFTFGFFQGAIALARTALEQATRDCVKSVPSADLTLSQLLRLASQLKLLNDYILQLAFDVKRTANDVLHERAASQKEAFEVLIKARTVLEQLYRRGA